MKLGSPIISLSMTSLHGGIVGSPTFAASSTCYTQGRLMKSFSADRLLSNGRQLSLT